jgi:alpha-1,6-mannosyltransferase
MRTLDISSFFSASCGGIKTYYREKARLLPRFGVDCHFAVPGSENGTTPFENGTLHTITGPRVPWNTDYRLFGDTCEIVSLIARLQPDLIEIGSHTLLPELVHRALRAQSQTHTRVVGFFHSDIPRTQVEPASRWLPPPLARMAVARAWAFVRARHAAYDATLVASREVLTTLQAQGVPRVRWVGLGVDTGVFRPRPKLVVPAVSEASPLTVVYAGRLSSDKGFPLILSAFARLLAQPQIHLHVLGAGPGSDGVERLVRQYPGRVRFDGYVADRTEVATALACADLALTPGARETFSLATAEALACGTPVLAADEGAARELVELSGAGRLFGAGNVDSLVEGVTSFLALPLTERLGMGVRGRLYATSTLSWHMVMERLVSLYGELVAQPRQPGMAVAA